MNSPVLVLDHVRKSYAENGRVVPVLKDVTFSVERGETIAVIGASGSGKSTLLHAAGGLDGFDAGSIRLDGEELAGLNGAALDALRNRKLGFIYQFHHLLPEFTALENAAMPLLIARVPREKAFAKAKALLEKWAWAKGSSTFRRNSRGASVSERQWPAPWLLIPSASSPMSRPGTLTPKPPSPFLTFLPKAPANAGLRP